MTQMGLHTMFDKVWLNIFHFFIDPYLFLYAGQGDKGRSLGDFYILNLKTFTWRRLFLVEAPPSRHHHTWTEISKKKTYEI